MLNLGSLKAILAKFDPAKLAAMGVVALVVLGAVFWVATRAEPMGLLYSGLDPAEAGKISQRLDELKIPYQAGADGGSISIPASQVARVRMELASAGLPHQGGAGYELLDTQSPMNMTSFMQRLEGLRALEGELARTIMTLNGVKSARVHIVMPEREDFSRETAKPTASIAVTMNGPERLGARQAAAIRLLVAGAVPKLNQDDVSVIDPSGVVLAADGSDAMATDRLEELKQSEEQALQRATLELLEPLVGPGHVRSVVSVQLDGSREVSHEEKFDPLSQVERSRQTQSDQQTSNDGKANPPVSVSQNIPNQQQAGTPGQDSTSSTHTGQTVNYELNSVRSDSIREPGDISRLTVAVVVDGITDDKGAFQPRPKAQLDQIAALVKSAVGFDAKRGDVVTVDTMRFIPPEAAAVEDGGGVAPVSPGLPWIPFGVVVLLACTVITMLLRRRRAARQAETGAAVASVRLADAAPPPPEPERLANPYAPGRNEAVDTLFDVVDARPDEALAVLRAWIADGAPA